MRNRKGQANWLLSIRSVVRYINFTNKNFPDILIHISKYSISIENFSKSFGNIQAVKNLSFEINDGEVFAFLGTNGSGKTTTIRCLLKIYQADEGKLLINGKEFSEELIGEEEIPF